jgi:hypothetical protein
LQRLISLGAFSREATDFLRSASEQGGDLVRLFQDPQAEAERLKLDVTAETATQLKALNIGDPERIEDPVDREIVEFFHKAAADGRHLNDWATRPGEVAERLGIKLSRAANDRIVAVSNINLGIHDPSTVMSPAAVAIVVVVVIVVWDRERRLPVEDLSGIEKF